MVYYVESVYGKDWVVDGQLNYTTEEIVKGLEFIQSLEDNHVIPTAQTLTGDGADSLDKNPKWMEGKYAGIFEWDSSASKFEKALNEGQELSVLPAKTRSSFSRVWGWAITLTRFPTARTSPAASPIRRFS